MIAASATAQQIRYDDLEQVFQEPVTTSATGKPQRASEVPADMEIITAEDIRRSGADNLPDILQFVAGLNIRRYGFAAADIGVRGYNESSNPRLLVLLNGQQVYLDDLGRTQWYTLPVELDEIRQIEVVKGPQSALFGFNAASGVINIVTYDPLYDSLNRVTTRAGTGSYGSLSAVGTGKIGDAGGVRVSLGGFQASEFGPEGVAPGDLAYRFSPMRDAANVNAHVRVAPGIELFAFGGAVDTRMWEATASPYYGMDYQRTNWSRVGAVADTAAGQLSLNFYRNELAYSYNGATEREDLHDVVTVAEASDLVKLGLNHTIRAGFEYRNNTATSSDVIPGHAGYDVVSGSLMWNWEITPTLSLTNAGRYDYLWLHQSGPMLNPDSGLTSASYNGRIIEAFSFNSGLVWAATETDTFRLLAGRGLQLPSIYDFDLQDTEVYGGQNYFYVGQPALRPATVTNVELAWDRTLAPIHSHLRAAVFLQRTDDILMNPYNAEPAGSGIVTNGYEELIFSAANIGHSSAAGGEIELRGQSPSGFRWNASYSYVSIADHLAINRDGLFTAQDYQHGTPTHSIVLGGGYSRDRWELDVQGRWQSWYLDFRADPDLDMLQQVNVSNYLAANAHIGYRLTDNVSLGLTATQFNTAHLLQAGAPPVQRRLFATISAHF